ncbi:MAG: DUF58 domain-containing protein [Chitinophagales bacterium]|nr:DUF58 domain-containing protein [Chitinophagales bacterium]
MNLHNETFHQFDNIEILAKQVVEGFIIGLHKSPFHGFSVEFAEHRLHNTGDSVKDIDWKVFARTDKMYVKKFEEETNLRCQIVVDASSSMYFPQEKGTLAYNKIEFSALAAAAMMHMLKKQRDAVGLTIFGEDIQVSTKASSTTLHHKLLLSHLHQLMQSKPAKVRTNVAKALHQIADSIHKRSLVVIFSDMMDNFEQKEELFHALQHLKHAKHEVILFHVVDKSKELDFEFENRPYHFIDMETGVEIKLQANQVKAHYVAEMAKVKAALKLQCAQYKIDFVEADIQQGFNEVLLPYLVKRAKMRV